MARSPLSVKQKDACALIGRKLDSGEITLAEAWRLRPYILAERWDLLPKVPHRWKYGLMPRPTDQKLTPQKRLEIIALKGTLRQFEVARRYGVTRAVVSRLWRKYEYSQRRPDSAA